MITSRAGWAVNFGTSKADRVDPFPGLPMIRPAQPPIPADKARALLRKLRDLNLSAGPIAITRRVHVAIAGCLSLDGPAEAGVRYRLRAPDGSEGTLEIAGCPSGLAFSVIGPSALPRVRSLRVEVTCDHLGRACARTLGARVSPETCDARELEHFLRRVVRALMSR